MVSVCFPRFQSASPQLLASLSVLSQLSKTVAQNEFINLRGNFHSNFMEMWQVSLNILLTDGIILWILIFKCVFVNLGFNKSEDIRKQAILLMNSKLHTYILKWRVLETLRIKENSNIETLQWMWIHWNLSKSAGWAMKMLKWIDATF